MFNMAQKLYWCPTWPVYSLDQLKSEKVPEQTQEKGGERAKKEITEREKKNKKKQKKTGERPRPIHVF